MLNEKIPLLLSSEKEDDRLMGLKSLASNGLEDHLALLYRSMGDESWRVRKEAVELFFCIPNPAALTGEIIELLHSQENAGLRNAAVEILTRFGRQATMQLIEELSCPDHDVRKFILDILGDIGDDRAASEVLTALSDQDTNVRAAAAENLGKLKVRAAAPALLDAMPQGDLMFKFTALEALAAMQADIQTEKLLAFQTEPLLRKALFDCLGLIGDASAVPVLVAALTDKMGNVVEAAALALVRLAERGTVDLSTALNDSLDVEPIQPLLQSRSEAVRRAAVSLLGTVATSKAVALLLPLLDDQEFAQPVAETLVTIGRSKPLVLLGFWSEAETSLRVYLAYLYGESGCVGCVTELREGLRDQEMALRHAAAQSLGALGDKSALPALIESLEDESPEVMAAIVAALSRLGQSYPTETLTAVSPLLEDEKADKRASAVTVLGGLQGGDIDRSLAFAMKDESADVRRAAVKALDGRQSEEQLQSLLLALTDEDADVRRMATEILGHSQAENLVEALQLALQDEDIWVRSAAVRSLGQVGSLAALQQVEKALQDPVGLVVIGALETLAEHPQAAMTPHLLEALEHVDEEVVNCAVNLLSCSPSTAWIENYGEALLNHKNWEVRLSAARTLAACQGTASAPLLESRLLIEGEDLVRQELQGLLMALQEIMD